MCLSSMPNQSLAICQLQISSLRVPVTSTSFSEGNQGICPDIVAISATPKKKEIWQTTLTFSVVWVARK